MTGDITLRGPADVVALLPYQLGYQPTESVVVVTLRSGRVGLVARTDLPPDDVVEATVEVVLGPVRREAPDAVVLVGYESVPESSHPLLTALVEELEADHVTVLGVDVVRGGRRYSPVCSDPCCPPGGVPLPDPADVPAVAELVALGRAPLASREAVSGLVEPTPEAGEVGKHLSRPRPRAGPDVGVRAWARVLAPPGHRRAPDDTSAPWPPRVVADAVAALSDVQVRDALVGWLTPGVLPRRDLDAVVLARFERTLPRWAGMGAWGTAVDRPPPESFGAHGTRRLLLDRLLLLSRCVPDTVPGPAAAVCTVAAHVAWCDGDGAVARVALDRALRLEPGYRLAGLLARLVEHGLRVPTSGAGGAEGAEIEPRAG
jgi:hypothetical protein